MNINSLLFKRFIKEFQYANLTQNKAGMARSSVMKEYLIIKENM